MTVAPSIIAAAISTAPAWALVGLTMPDADMRERGAEELARWIAERIEAHPEMDRREISLPL